MGQITHFTEYATRTQQQSRGRIIFMQKHRQIMQSKQMPDAKKMREQNEPVCYLLAFPMF